MKEGDILKLLRRSIIVICLILLIPLIVSFFSRFFYREYYSKDLKQLVKDGKADVIEVNKKIKIDNDTIQIQKIVNTNDSTNLIYRTNESPGWSFSNSALVLYDEKGKKQKNSSEGSMSILGAYGIISYDKIDKDSKKLIVKLEWYDRTGQLVVPVESR